jgi:signal transduction histidine kinase
MKDQLYFRVSSGLKNIIGKELITDDNIAVFELVKNSYDAHATDVEIIFENLYSREAKIIIKDNGKGMSYSDLIEKWLFVAYSAKKDGTEDSDNISYRDLIHGKRAFAGAKGIGRFSCDRLGRKLKLVTTKKEEGAKTEVLYIDWDKFEENSKEEFINVSVDHESIESNSSDHGTILEISELRREDEWNRAKLLKLKDSLSKLINPFEDKTSNPFSITITVDEEAGRDSKESEYRDRVNGPVKNVVFDVLDLKTTKVITTIDESGKYIVSELFDGGTFIYRLKERNPYSVLKNIKVDLYFLTRKAKLNFNKKMGFSSSKFGSIFLYKNGFRIFPFGEPGEDSFKLDVRKLKRRGSYLGNNELIGQIRITDTNDLFVETSSRDSGFIINEAFNQLTEFFIESVVTKLERYVIEVQEWGIGLEDVTNEDEEIDLKSKIFRLISRISSGKDIVDLEYDDSIITILESIQEDAKPARVLVNNLRRIASESENSGEIIEYVDKIDRHIEGLRDDLRDIDKELHSTKAIIKERESQNLFLKSVKSQDLDEVVNLMHQVGIAANTINNYLVGLAFKVKNNIEISNEVLRRAIEMISFENNKVLAISRFATKANFKLRTEYVQMDLNNFIYEYVTNIAQNFRGQNIDITIERFTADEFSIVFRPIEIIILIDNMISNARKAKAKEIKILVDSSEEEFFITFEDNGLGVDEEFQNQIFDYGFTTTDGSGLGLSHISEIVQKLNGTIELDSSFSQGARFVIVINKM